MKQKCICPMCKGSGKIIKMSYVKYTPKQRQRARDLYSKGFSLREIGKKLKIDGSPQKIKSMMFAKTF